MADAPTAERAESPDATTQLPSWVPGWVSALLRLRPVQFVWRLVDEVTQDDVFGLSAEMAYRFLFSLFPFLIFLAAFVGYIGTQVGSSDLVAQVLRLMGMFFPPDVQAVLAEWVQSVLATQSTGLLTVGAATALWAAAGGVGTLIKGLNRAYHVRENRPFWISHLLALITTISLAVLMLGGVFLYTIGGTLATWAVEKLGADEHIWFWLNLLRGPGVMLGLGLVLSVMYAMLPNRRLRIRQTLAGALFATAGWMLLTWGFGYYVANLGSFDRTFGSLGAAVLLMVWMYAVALILLVGGEINSLLSGIKSEQESAPAVEDERDARPVSAA
jgi:membrane protein